LPCCRTIESFGSLEAKTPETIDDLAYGLLEYQR